MLLNATEIEKYVKHICSTGLAQPINGPCVQFAVSFVSDSGKKKKFSMAGIRDDERERHRVSEDGRE